MHRPLPRNLSELVAHAIGCERDAASRFQLFANHLHEMGYRDTADIFRRLALAERAHLEALEDCVAAGKLPELQPSDNVRHLLAMRNALELAFPCPPPRNARDALVRALAAERRAEIYYRDAAAYASDPMVRGFAADLAAGEHRHVRLVERLLARLPA